VHRLPAGEGTVVVLARRIHTLDPARPLAEAVAMREGRVLAVGGRAEVLAAAGEGATVEEFPRSTIVPGLVDAHGHLAGLGAAAAVQSLQDARSEGEAAALLKRAGAAATLGGWVLGRGWDQNRWTGGAFPGRASLDAVFPGVPVVAWRIDGHALWASSEALRRAGVTSATRDPEGGRLMRDARGEPTGVLVDAAMELVGAKVPAATEEELAGQLKVALETCARLGLTGVHDAGTELAVLRILQHWDVQGRLPVRVYAMAPGMGAEADEALGLGLYKGRSLELRTVKLGVDGALGSRGAALFEPYADEPTSRGLLGPADEFEARARRFAAAGFQVAVHAIGDRGNALALDVLERLEAARPGSRHRQEHSQVLRVEDIPRYAKAGLVASYQPTHATSDMPWAEARLGKARLAGAYAWRTMLDSGAHVAFGSDFPVEDPNPLWGLYAARTRQDREGQPPGGWLPEQRVTALEALAGFTTGAAWASFSEDRRGMLKPGFDADLVVLPVDPVEDPPERLLDARVQVTFVGGVDVYRAKE
jgi:predicted amidohydrolase YtcJ